jgi:nucleoside 2-deoxyribosyltransferase
MPTIYLSGPLFSRGEIAWGGRVKSLNEADLMVALLDGPQVDDGTAWEVGYFFSQGKKILGIKTDFRRAGETDASRVNLMIECSCLAVAGSLEALASDLERLLY